MIENRETQGKTYKKEGEEAKNLWNILNVENCDKEHLYKP